MVNVKVMLELIKDEPEDAYIPIVKPELMALLKEVKILRSMCGKQVYEDTAVLTDTKVLCKECAGKDGEEK